jgi:hypothetical protein
MRAETAEEWRKPTLAELQTGLSEDETQIGEGPGRVPTARLEGYPAEVLESLEGPF